MTEEYAIERLQHKIKCMEDGAVCCDFGNDKEVFKLAIKALEQEPILEKIYADIQNLRGCSCSCSDGIIDEIEDILDKYQSKK